MMSNIRMRVSIAVVAIGTAGIWAYFAFFGQDKEALKILDRMVKKYAACQSFRDRIQVTRENKTYQATIAFQRPASIRYEFNEINSQGKHLTCFIVGKSVKGVSRSGGLDSPVITKDSWNVDFFTFLDGRPYVEHDLAIDHTSFYLLTATAFTDTVMIGLLLPDDIGGLQFRDMDDCHLVGTETVGNRDCFVLKSRQWDYKLWIDKESYALLKTVEDEGRGDTTMLLNPQFEVEVRANEFNVDVDKLQSNGQAK